MLENRGCNSPPLVSQSNDDKACQSGWLGHLDLVSSLGLGMVSFSHSVVAYDQRPFKLASTSLSVTSDFCFKKSRLYSNSKRQIGSSSFHPADCHNGIR